MPMNGPKIMALLGAALLLAGVFTPIANVPIVGDMTYFASSKAGGMILVALALVSGGLALSDRVRDVAWPGAAAVAVLALSFYLFERRISEMREHLGHRLIGRLLRGLADVAVDRVQLQWGWAVLVLGAVLLVGAGLMARGKGSGPAG
jgi:hypothetical protein